MPRKKAPVPTPKHVTEEAKQRRQLQSRHEAKHKNGHAKPRVKLGSPEAEKLGIK